MSRAGGRAGPCPSHDSQHYPAINIGSYSPLPLEVPALALLLFTAWALVPSYFTATFSPAVGMPNRRQKLTEPYSMPNL